MKDVLHDLSRQTIPFDLTIFDNGSTEEGFKDEIEKWKDEIEKWNTSQGIRSDQTKSVNLILNEENVPLNHIWNKCAKTFKNPYICFLNNDVRIPSNFIEDSEKILDNDLEIAITAHATNHPRYIMASKQTRYVEPRDMYQGWDYTIRRKLFYQIREDMPWFGGDRVQWAMALKRGYKTAMILSSPILHLQGETKKNRGSLKHRNTMMKALGEYGKIRTSFYSHPEFSVVRTYKSQTIIDIDGTIIETVAKRGVKKQVQKDMDKQERENMKEPLCLVSL